MVDNSNLSIVVVSYKSEKVLADLLSSIPYDSELIIVNNGPEKSPQNLKNIRSFIEIHDGQNKGFGKACNIGVEAASNELILLINPDSILEKNCLVNLIEAMKGGYPMLQLLHRKLLTQEEKRNSSDVQFY